MFPVSLFEPRTLQSKFTFRLFPCERLFVPRLRRVCVEKFGSVERSKGFVINGATHDAEKELNRFKVFNACKAAYGGGLEVFVCFRSLFQLTFLAENLNERCKIKSRFAV